MCLKTLLNKLVIQELLYKFRVYHLMVVLIKSKQTYSSIKEGKEITLINYCPFTASLWKVHEELVRVDITRFVNKLFRCCLFDTRRPYWQLACFFKTPTTTYNRFLVHFFLCLACVCLLFLYLIFWICFGFVLLCFVLFCFALFCFDGLVVLVLCYVLN